MESFIVRPARARIASTGRFAITETGFIRKTMKNEPFDGEVVIADGKYVCYSDRLDLKERIMRCFGLSEMRMEKRK